MYAYEGIYIKHQYECTFHVYACTYVHACPRVCMYTYMSKGINSSSEFVYVSSSLDRNICSLPLASRRRALPRGCPPPFHWGTGMGVVSHTYFTRLRGV